MTRLVSDGYAARLDDAQQLRVKADCGGCRAAAWAGAK